MFATMQTAIFDEGVQFEKFRDQLEITDSRIVFGDRKTGSVVSVLGTIQNKTSISWKEVVFRVDFKDAQGRVIDAGQKEEISFFVPANDTFPIKLSFPRDFPETNYVSHSIRIISAKDGGARW
jgi:hypothetical protein